MRYALVLTSLLMALAGCDITLTNASCGQNSVVCSSPPSPSCSAGGASDLMLSGFLTQPVQGSASASANPDGAGATLSMRGDAVEVRVYFPASHVTGALPEAGTYAAGDHVSTRIRFEQAGRPAIYRDAVGTVTVDAVGGLRGRIDLDAAFSDDTPRLHIGGTFRAAIC